MIDTGAEPVRWLRGSGGTELVVSRALYRRQPWVGVFLSILSERLPGSGLADVHLDARRPALVLTGQTATGALRVAEALYRDVLLFHPGLHPHVEDLFARAIFDAAAELAERGFVEGDEIRRHGRRALLAEPGLLLDADVVAGLAQVGVRGLPAMGVTGIVELHWRTGDFVLASLRSDRVAVNPGCLAPAVDGGMGDADGDPRRGLERELRDELPWPLEDIEWTSLGVLVPQGPEGWVGDHRTRRGGANVVYHTVVKGDPEVLLRTGSRHFETVEMVAIEKSGAPARARLPPVWAQRHGAVVRLDGSLPVSEVLAASLARLDVVELGPAPPSSPPSSIPSSGPARSEAAMNATATTETSTPTRTSAPPIERSLEYAWAELLLKRYPRILDAVDDPDTLDLREKDSGPAGEVEAVVDAVREYELVCRSNQLENVDEARLFEAVVVRLSHNLFSNDAERALAVFKYLDSISARQVGATYQARLRAAIARDADRAVTALRRDRAEATGADIQGIELDEAEREQALEIPNEVAKRLRGLDTDEASTAYSEVKRRSLLLCFCSALWAIESKRSTAAADVALDQEFREIIAGDAIALFFRARALLVSPVASSAQTQLGLQFVTAALSYFPTNPGMHHTRALFLLRKSSTVVGEQESMECLDQALHSVEEALKWDAEFAVFYATRAKVKYRMHNRSGALVDIRAAIELARYGRLSSAAARDIKAWEDLLEGWDLAPVGVASGAGS